MKSLYEHRERKALRQAERTGRQVTFWYFGGHGSDVYSREGWYTAYPDGELWAHYSHHYDGSTHYQEYSERIS